MTTRVGFVGLGNIGRPMALRLASQPCTLRVYDVDPAPVRELEAAGAVVEQSLAEFAEECSVISVMVRDDAQVRQVVDQLLGPAVPGTTIAIHSTVAPGLPEELAAEAAEHDVHLVDAPVSGGSMGAAEGTLAILVGGSDEAFAAVEPTMRLMGSKVVHAGPVGAGTRFKLARNLLHFVAFTAATEAARLAEAAGLDLVALGDVVRHTDAITGGPGAILHRDTTAALGPDDFWHGVLSHVRTLGEKDLRLALDLAASLGVDTPLARLALDRLGPGLGLEEQ